MEVHPNAWMFFVPFILATTYTVINLVVGIIVSALEEKSMLEHTSNEPTASLARMEKQLHDMDEKISRFIQNKNNSA